MKIIRHESITDTPNATIVALYTDGSKIMLDCEWLDNGHFADPQGVFNYLFRGYLESDKNPESQQKRRNEMEACMRTKTFSSKIKVVDRENPRVTQILKLENMFETPYTNPKYGVVQSFLNKFKKK